MPIYAAKATYAKAKADLEKILAGSWKEDIEIARAAVELAESQVESIKINLERADRSRPDGRRSPPAQRAPRPVRRDDLERAHDRSGRQSSGFTCGSILTRPDSSISRRGPRRSPR